MLSWIHVVTLPWGNRQLLFSYLFQKWALYSILGNTWIKVWMSSIFIISQFIFLLCINWQEVSVYLFHLKWIVINGNNWIVCCYWYASMHNCCNLRSSIGPNKQIKLNLSFVLMVYFVPLSNFYTIIFIDKWIEFLFIKLHCLIGNIELHIYLE